LRRTQDQHIPLHLSLLITHGHSDHLVGFPFFAPLFERRTTIDIFGPVLQNQSIEQLVTPLMSPPYFPVDIHTLPSERTFHTITGEQYIIWQHSSEGVGNKNSKPQIVTHQEDTKNAELCISTKFVYCQPLDGATLYRREYADRRLG